MDLHSFFAPSSIAIVGVSHDPKKVGYLVAKNLLDQGFSGPLFFINPKGGELFGKQVYISLDEISENIDLVVLAIPAQGALSLLPELAKRGIHEVVLFAAGFKETGEEGKKLEAQLASLCQEHGITLLGPNCIGFLATPSNVNATFLKYGSKKGTIGFVSQSGALGSYLSDYFAAHPAFGFSYFVSLGNKTVLNETDVLEFLADDPHTEVIGMYLENVVDGKRFRDVLCKTTKKKPVVILKSGRTAKGSQAALSHTGGLVGDDAVFDTIFRQCGAIRAENLNEFKLILELYSAHQIPQSDTFVVLSNAGGVGVLLADDLILKHIELNRLPPAGEQELSEAFPEKKISLHNPIDLLGDASADDYQKALTIISTQGSIGGVIILLTPQANTEVEETAKNIIDFHSRCPVPVYPVFMGEASVATIHRLFEENGMVSFETYDGLASALQAMIAVQDRVQTRESDSPMYRYSLSLLANKKEIDDLFQTEKAAFFSFQNALKTLEYVGIPVENPILVHSEEDIPSALQLISYPLAAKLASETITHKTEVHGVRIGIQTEAALRAAVSEMMAIPGSSGCYLQQMVKGQELFVGAKRDRTFGTILVLGLGGIYTELIKDVSQRVFPFSKQDFTAMLGETKAGRLVAGFRGSSSLDPELLYTILIRLGLLLEHYPHIQEVDINPLILAEKGFVAVDARVILGTQS
ncbi:hypothetical protein HGA88_01570 [Candidatus Roizmanbacteria bacterium]|nr:hypothetical protein [Candidatus Roizmanbacteria bacterium]